MDTYIAVTLALQHPIAVPLKEFSKQVKIYPCISLGDTDLEGELYHHVTQIIKANPRSLIVDADGRGTSRCSGYTKEELVLIILKAD